MTKRAISLLTSLIMLLVSIFLLLCYYVFKTDKITLHLNANNVIDINSDRILGLKAGIVTVDLIARLDNQSYKTSIEVTVLSNSYTYSINPIENCIYQNGILYSYGDDNLFTVDVFDKDGSKLNNLEFTLHSQDVIFTSELAIFYLKTDKGCQVSIEYKIGLTIIIQVIKI